MLLCVENIKVWGEGGMSADTRDIEVRIWDEIDSGVTETCVIRLERGQNLCDVLESKRALVWWYHVYSINLHTSPPLNWRPRESTPTQTRFMVNRWGESLFDWHTREHCLKLHLDVPVVRADGGARRGVPTPGKPRGE
jgi:hypothetical protein